MHAFRMLTQCQCLLWPEKKGTEVLTCEVAHHCNSVEPCKCAVYTSGSVFKHLHYVLFDFLIFLLESLSRQLSYFNIKIYFLPIS